MADQRALDAFDVVMSQRDKISEGKYRATTAKRLTTIPPAGVMIYDTDRERWYTGDGVVTGGTSNAANDKVRVLTVAAAAASGTILVDGTATGSNVQFTDPKITQLRTADSLTFATAAGTVPSGIGTGEKWLIKTTPDSASGALASSRVNALAGTSLTVFNSGALGYTTVISTISSDKTEDVIYVKAAAACTILLPNEEQAEDYSVLVRKSVQDQIVTISGTTSAGAVGGLQIEASGGSSIALRISTGDYCRFYLDKSTNEYIITDLVNA
jgi:hypothetical protein